MNRLKALRVEKSLTQSQFGEIIGAGKSAVSLWESGKREPDNETLLKIAEYFGVTVDYILGNDSPAASPPAYPGAAKLAAALDGLSDENLVKLLDYAKLLLLQQKEEQKK